jgi:hypothetical protein
VRALFIIFLGLILRVLFGRVSLGVLVSIFLSEEVWGRESSRVGFSSNPKFRFFLKKCDFFSLFLGFDFDGCSSVVSLVSLCRIFCLRFKGRQSSRVRSNPKFRVFLEK